MKQNSLYSWYLACRPKTLSGALISVFCGSALAFSHHSFHWQTALLCALFASLMQIASNLINDLYDFLRGTDGEERLGPERACAQGWISPTAMQCGINVVCCLAALAGVGILWAFLQSDAYAIFSENISHLFGNLSFPFIIGLFVLVIAIVISGAFLYTTFGSYHGLGDFLVYAFFGYIPTCGTYLVQTGYLDWEIFILATAVALVVDTLLVLNNYRDRDTDKASGKLTLVARFGEHFGQQFYFWQGILAWLCISFLGLHGHHLVSSLTVIYALVHSATWREMKRIHHGRELNRILGKTSRNMLIFAALAVIALILG